MNDFITGLTQALVLIAVIILLTSALGGVMTGIDRNLPNNECDKSRIIYYVVPTFKLGCWLTREIKP
jgi:hypothetical protein